VSWFEVDRDGLRQLLEDRDKSFIVRELVQNAWDEPGVTSCDVTLEPVPGRKAARLVVEDDAPEGFYDLTHAYTMFARTRKRTSPDKRGRFNLGEKQVLALCREAKIVTTKGTVEFLPDGKRKEGKARRKSGSSFEATLEMTRAEIKACAKAASTFLPPAGIRTTFNGKPLPVREPLAAVEATLATEFENGQGQYRRTRRATVIHVYEPLPGEQAALYEMGLPVVETGDRWHYDIQQRVPLNADRDNVQPSFLRDVRAAVVNALSDRVSKENAAEPWARDATQSSRIEKQAFEQVMHKRHGRKLVARAVNDPEANHAAAAHGYEVLAGGALTGDEWKNAKRFESFQAASQIFPTDNPTSGPGSKSTTIPQDKWTPGMRQLAEYVEGIGRELVGGLVVRIVRDSGNRRFSAWYGGQEITFNLQRVGHRFFNDFPANMERVNSLLLHEIAHERESDHLSDRYHSAICDFGARLTQLALDGPKLFKVRRPKKTKAS